MSQSLATKTIASVEMQKPKITYAAGQLRNLTHSQVEQLVQTILETTLQLVMIDVTKWIQTYVPRRTGQLQDNLLANFQSSYIQNGRILKLKLGTNIDYAQYVNKMSSTQVQHFGVIGYAYYYGSHGPIILSDPSAQGHYQGIMLMYARDRLRFHLKNVKQNILGSVGVAAKPFAQMKVTI